MMHSRYVSVKLVHAQGDFLTYENSYPREKSSCNVKEHIFKTPPSLYKVTNRILSSLISLITKMQEQKQMFNLQMRFVQRFPYTENFLTLKQKQDYKKNMCKQTISKRSELKFYFETRRKVVTVCMNLLPFQLKITREFFFNVLVYFILTSPWHVSESQHFQKATMGHHTIKPAPWKQQYCVAQTAFGHFVKQLLQNSSAWIILANAKLWLMERVYFHRLQVRTWDSFSSN